MAEVGVRRADPAADWAAYREIRLRALADSPSAYASSLEREQDFPPSRWRELLTGADTFLADGDGELVGTATGWSNGPGAVSVVAMFVIPEARGRRVAHLLLDAVRAAAIERGAGLLTLEVADGNWAAQRSYLAYGFVPSGRRHPMERDPSIVEVELELNLSPVPRG